MRKVTDAHILGATVLPADSRTCIEFLRQLYPQRFCDRVCGVSVVFGFERHIYLTPKINDSQGIALHQITPAKIAYLPRLIADSPERCLSQQEYEARN
jgi:hypothetical protein